MKHNLAILKAARALELTVAAVILAVIVCGGALLLWNTGKALLQTPETFSVGNFLSSALLLDLVVCNGFLKPLIGRLRPFQINTAIELLTQAPLDASFPSGHTAASLTAVTALWRAGGAPKWLRWAALILAVVIALSRIYLYVHWPTDVLGGAVLGAVLGWTGAWLVFRLRRRLRGPEER